MGEREKTTIEIDAEVWRLLQSRKGIGDSFNDVLRRDYGLDDAADETRSDNHDDSHDDAPREHADAAASRDEIAAALEGWEPESGPAPRGRQLVRQAVDILQADGGWLTRSEIWSEMDSPVGERTTMERNVMPGLAALREYGLVETRREGFETAHHRWRDG